MDYGKVVRFDAERGFGFIAPDRGGPDLFLHVSNLDRGSDVRQLKPGAQVSYLEGSGPRGTKATQVKVITSSPEDAWPEYAQPEPAAAGVMVPLTEESLLVVFQEMWTLFVTRAKENGWVA